MNGIKNILTRFREAFVPDKDGNCEMREAGTYGIVDAGKTAISGTIPVTILKFGKSPTPPYFVYTKEAMGKNMPIFEGARVYLNKESDNYGHRWRNENKTSADIIGFITKPKITNDAVIGEMSILPSADWFRENIVFLNGKKRLDIYQLSIDAGGKALLKDYQGETLPHAELFAYLDVDIVPRGAMGGEFMHLMESLPNYLTEPKQKQIQKEKKVMNKTKLMLMTLFTMLYPQFLESKKLDVIAINENELFTHLMEADKPQNRLNLPDGFQLKEDTLKSFFDKFMESFNKPAEPAKKTDQPAKKTDQPNAPSPAAAPDNSLTLKMQEAQKLFDVQLQTLTQKSRQMVIESKMLESKLPAQMQLLVKERFSTNDGIYVEFKEADVDAYIKTIRERFEKSYQTLPDVKIIRTEKDKVNAGLFGFFAESTAWAKTKEGRAELTKELNGVAPFTSIREAYQVITGDEKVTGIPSRTRMLESINTADWSYAVADNANRVMVREYALMGLDDWRKFADVVPLNDFKTNHRIRWGGYGTLPTVGQRATYPALSSPTDEEATYAATKKGGLEEISREMIINDDVAFVRGIPRRLAYAAARTLYETVTALINPNVNGTIYDSVALYHSNHLNTGTVAMGTDGSGIQACAVRMAKYLEKNSSKRMGIKPKFVMYPADLRATAYTAITAMYGVYNQVPTMVQSYQLEGLENPFWTDATDYCVIANPNQVLGLEVGFVNNQQEPEIFVSDIPNTGSYFTNDVVTMKIRHEYGAAITDWRAFDGQIVA